ncbi:MAG: ArnT family glycosyltransferase [Flavobacteriales bacterium]
MIKNISIEHRVLITIALLFSIRLFHITTPPIEVSHNWRQTTSMMVARNFTDHGPDLLRPTIDETGTRVGVIGMEIPVLPAGIYLMSEVFGYDHWYGRLIVLFFSSVGIWYFFLLTRKRIQEKYAWFATLAFAFSALFHLSRKVMPDPLSLSFIIMAVYFGWEYLESGFAKHGVAFLITAFLGAGIKIPFAGYLILLSIPFLQGSIPTKRKVVLVLLGTLALFPVLYWYFVWNPKLSVEFGQWYNSGTSLSAGMKDIATHGLEVFDRICFSPFHAYSAFALVILGVLAMIKKRESLLLRVWLWMIPVWMFFMAKSGFFFVHHGYYAMIFIPVFAWTIAFALHQFKGRWVMGFAFVLCAEAFANQQHDFFVHDRDKVKLQLESIANSCSSPADKVALVSNLNPNEFYFLHRKGWIVPADQTTPDQLLTLATEGAKCLFVPKAKYPELRFQLPMLFENVDYVVYDLKALTSS